VDSDPVVFGTFRLAGSGSDLASAFYVIGTSSIAAMVLFSRAEGRTNFTVLKKNTLALTYLSDSPDPWH
jgi:hypothetical protein